MEALWRRKREARQHVQENQQVASGGLAASVQVPSAEGNHPAVRLLPVGDNWDKAAILHLLLPEDLDVAPPSDVQMAGAATVEEDFHLKWVVMPHVALPSPPPQGAAPSQSPCHPSD